MSTLLNVAKKHVENAVCQYVNSFPRLMGFKDRFGTFLNLYTFSAVSSTEAPSITTKATTMTICEDISTKCEFFKIYCGLNSYVTKRCQKTCGLCSKSVLIHFYVLTTL